MIFRMENPILSVVQNPFFVKYGLIGLFLNGVLSSITPIPTEITTSALLLSGESKTVVFIVLAAGSIIGGYLSYYIGYSGNTLFKKLRKAPSRKQSDRAAMLLARYGLILIFMHPWIPVFGDVIAIIAGAKKYDLRKYTIAMIGGKTTKGVAIIYLTSWLLPLIFPQPS